MARTVLRQKSLHDEVGASRFACLDTLSDVPDYEVELM